MPYYLEHQWSSSQCADRSKKSIKILLKVLNFRCYINSFLSKILSIWQIWLCLIVLWAITGNREKFIGQQESLTLGCNHSSGSCSSSGSWGDSSCFRCWRSSSAKSYRIKNLKKLEWVNGTGIVVITLNATDCFCEVQFDSPWSNNNDHWPRYFNGRSFFN